MKKSLPLLIIVLILAAVAYYISVTMQSASTGVKSQTQFEISDTSSVGKIIIVSAGSGSKVKLERQENNTWLVNDQFRAREDAIETLLKTFKNIYVQRPVKKESVESSLRIIAGGSKKVEIFDRNGDWIKTWYVGHASKDNKGTHMLLETPGSGKSHNPFIMDMKGFIGMLNTRFFTDENEWRSVGILNYPNMDIEEVEVTYPDQLDKSFRITYGGGNEIKLYPHKSETEISTIDSSLVKDYLLNFKLASFENYKTGLSPAEADSVMQQTPYQVIRIKDKKREREIRLWPKKVKGEEAAADRADPEVDGDRVYAATEAGELALAQRYGWDKFRAPLQAFLVD
ncbi:MAG: hypothetical protein ABR574_11620 [Cryomorphaceae bacterium]|nr:hypothetical protein [Flavobacteriales bacterium]